MTRTYGSSSNNLQVVKMHPDAQIPTRGTPGSAGFDLYCVEDSLIRPSAHALIPTGIAIQTPFGFYGRVAPRSGLAISKGLNVHAGVIDPDYTGEIRVALINHGASVVEIRKGERIAQLILEWYCRCDAEWVPAFATTQRGPSGFGSTGV